MSDKFVLKHSEVKQPAQLELADIGGTISLRLVGLPFPNILFIDKKTGRIGRANKPNPDVGLELDDGGELVIH